MEVTGEGRSEGDKRTKVGERRVEEYLKRMEEVIKRKMGKDGGIHQYSCRLHGEGRRKRERKEGGYEYTINALSEEAEGLTLELLSLCSTSSLNFSDVTLLSLSPCPSPRWSSCMRRRSNITSNHPVCVCGVCVCCVCEQFEWLIGQIYMYLYCKRYHAYLPEVLQLLGVVLKVEIAWYSCPVGQPRWAWGRSCPAGEACPLCVASQAGSR